MPISRVASLTLLIATAFVVGRDVQRSLDAREYARTALRKIARTIPPSARTANGC